MSSTICPGNSTECLLREILHATTPGYNWNPLNFAFTAALSILAFFVAVFGLLQAVFAAGPGRLKASRGAIGPVYSAKAHTRFDYTELRFRTVAFIPVIELGYIITHCDPTGDANPQKLSRARSPTTDPVAGWALLLHSLNLTHVPFNTTYVLTDYLPDDVHAPPALASVESIVILAIMNGCTTLKGGVDGFLTAIGPSMQLDFQIHPTMGPIANYKHFSHRKQALLLSPAHIQSVINEARGYFSFDDDDLFDPLFRPQAKLNPAFSYGGLGEAFDKALAICNHSHYPCRARNSVLKPDCDTMFQRNLYNSRDTFTFTSLMAGDAPIAAKVFPSNGTQLNRLLNGVKNALFSYIWPTRLVYEFSQLQRGEPVLLFRQAGFGPYAPPHFVSESFEHRSWAVFANFQAEKQQYSRPRFLHAHTLCQVVGEDQRALTLAVANDPLGPLRISEEVGMLAWNWLEDKDYFYGMDEILLDERRMWIQFQISEIDFWLSSKGGPDAVCACANLIYNTPYVLTTEEYDLTSDARPTYIRSKAIYIAPETLKEFNLPWEYDARDPTYVIIKQEIDSDLQEELFEHTKAIMLDRRNASTEQEIKIPRNNPSQQSNPQTSPSSDGSLYPGEAMDDLSGPALSFQAERKHHTVSVSSWNEREAAAHPGTPPPLSPPSSQWTGPIYPRYKGRPRNIHGRSQSISLESEHSVASIPQDELSHTESNVTDATGSMDQVEQVRGDRQTAVDSLNITEAFESSPSHPGRTLTSTRRKTDEVALPPSITTSLRASSPSSSPTVDSLVALQKYENEATKAEETPKTLSAAALQTLDALNEEARKHRAPQAAKSAEGSGQEHSADPGNSVTSHKLKSSLTIRQSGERPANDSAKSQRHLSPSGGSA